MSDRKPTYGELEQQVAELQEERDKLRIALKVTSDTIWEWDLKSGEIVLEDSWKEMLGYGDREGDLDLQWWQETIHPDDVPGFETSWQDYRSGKTPHYEAEYRLKMKSGQWVWINATGQCCKYDEDHQPVRMIGTHRDITARKEAERQLQQSRDFLNRTQAIAHVGSWHLDLEKNILTWSDENFRIFGFEPGEVTPDFETFLSSVHPDDREFVKTRYTTAIEQNIPYEATHRVLRRDGTVRTVHEISEEIHDGTGKAIASIGMTLDITELTQAETRLRESEALLREAQNAANIGSWSYDPVQQEVVWSEQMYRILGMDPLSGPPKPQALQAMFHPDDRDRQLKAIQNAVEHGTGYDNEVRLVLKDGTERIINTIGKPLQDGNGRTVKLVGSMRDITRQKELEQVEKKQAEQEQMALIGRITGKMAHDFNNVLGITIGTAELLLSEELPFHVRSEVEIIRQSALRGREITRNLLYFAREQDPIYARLKVSDIISGILKGLHRELAAIRVVTLFSHDEPEINADAAMLESALLNIVINSIHALSRTGDPVLTIRIDGCSACIRIQIDDNGCGIPQEHLPNVFEVSFTQKGRWDTRGCYAHEIKGSGYGLANARKSIHRHNGSIEIASEEGKGTTVTVKVPLTAGGTGERREPRAAVDQSGKKGRILIVEDELKFGNILQKVIRRHGHDVHLACDGKQALTLLAENRYDIISLDYVLPGMTGLEIYRQVRKTNPEVPIIFVSGNFEFMQSMIDLKATDPRVDHLAKPFHTAEFMNRLKTWLQ